MIPFSSRRELVLQLSLPVTHAAVTIALSVVFLGAVSVEAATVAKVKPESKALQWASTYTCEVSLCCGVGVAGRRSFRCSPCPCVVGVVLGGYLRLLGLA